MSTTTGITAASSKNSTSNSKITYSLNTGSYSSSAYTLNTTGIINSPYMPLTVNSTGSMFSNLNSYSWGTESLESKIQTSISKLTPIILNHRRNGVVKSAAIITKIYEEFSKQIQFFDDSMEKKMENYKTLWEISKCNEAFWVMNSRHENSSIALLCSQLVLHCH